jgi:hypothetical protein
MNSQMIRLQMVSWLRAVTAFSWQGADACSEGCYIAPFQGLVFLCYGFPGAMPQAGMELRRWRVGRERVAGVEGAGEGSEK